MPRELPSAVSGDTGRLTFHVTTLSTRGLLSQQIREALKSVMHDGGEERILQLRAFVAGSGDIRRVRDLVSEIFAARKQPLPALSLVQSGGLPIEGAQVIFEFTAEARKTVNPHGLLFLSAQPADAADPQAPVAPLAEKSLAALARNLQTAGSRPSDVLRTTCYLSSLDGVEGIRQAAAAEFPAATLDFVQTERAPARALAGCEAVARAGDAPVGNSLRSGQDRAQSGEVAVARVNSPQVVLTGTQDSFGYQENDARLAFERLARSLQQAGSSLHNTVFLHYYPLSPSIAAQLRKVRSEFFPGPVFPAASMFEFESLPSMDAAFAIDAVAAKN